MRSMILAVVLALAAPAAWAGEALTLDQAVGEALARNPGVLSEAAYLEAARSREAAARAEFFPTLSAGYRYLNLADAPFMNVLNRPTVVNTRDQVHWEISASQPLFTGFALLSGYRLAQLGVETRDLTAAQTRLETARQARAGYFNLLLAEKFLAVAESARENLAAHEADAGRFYNQGIIPKNDLLKAQVALSQAIQDRESAAARVKNARAALNVVLGRDYDADTRVAEWTEPALPDTDLSAQVEEALENRPEIRAIEKAMEGKDQEARLARSPWFPRVEVKGTYEQNGDDPEATHNAYSNDHNASVAVQAQWVFFEGGKTLAEASRARHEKDALAQTLAGARDQVRLEVQQAWLSLDVSQKNLATARGSLDQARENWRIENVRYNQQLSTSTDVLDARTFLTRAETAHYQALYGVGTALADLARAVGKP